MSNSYRKIFVFICSLFTVMSNNAMHVEKHKKLKLSHEEEIECPDGCGHTTTIYKANAETARQLAAHIIKKHSELVFGKKIAPIPIIQLSNSTFQFNFIL